MDNLKEVIKISYEDIQRRIKLRKIKFKIFLILFVISSVLLLILEFDIIKVNNIYINGNSIVQADTILDLSQIKQGDNLLKINWDKVNMKICKNPYIESCIIKKSIYGNVYINIIEKKSVAMAFINEKYIAFDKDICIIDYFEDRKYINVPLFKGLAIEKENIGEQIIFKDNRQKDVIKKIINNISICDLSDIIDEVDISNLLSITLKTKYEVLIKIGTIENLNNKLVVSKKIIEQDLLKRQLKGVLDVSYNSNPIFSPTY